MLFRPALSLCAYALGSLGYIISLVVMVRFGPAGVNGARSTNSGEREKETTGSDNTTIMAQRVARLAEQASSRANALSRELARMVEERRAEDERRKQEERALRRGTDQAAEHAKALERYGRQLGAIDQSPPDWLRG